LSRIALQRCCALFVTRFLTRFCSLSLLPPHFCECKPFPLHACQALARRRSENSSLQQLMAAATGGASTPGGSSRADRYQPATAITSGPTGVPKQPSSPTLTAWDSAPTPVSVLASHGFYLDSAAAARAAATSKGADASTPASAAAPAASLAGAHTAKPTTMSPETLQRLATPRSTRRSVSPRAGEYRHVIDADDVQGMNISHGLVRLVHHADNRLYVSLLLLSPPQCPLRCPMLTSGHRTCVAMTDKRRQPMKETFPWMLACHNPKPRLWSAADGPKLVCCTTTMFVC
jgi:hypothetical protein